MMLVDYLTPLAGYDDQCDKCGDRVVLQLTPASGTSCDSTRRSFLMPSMRWFELNLRSARFARESIRDHQIDGCKDFRAVSRVLMLYACANRDGTKYPDPGRFDIERQAE